MSRTSRTTATLTAALALALCVTAARESRAQAGTSAGSAKAMSGADAPFVMQAAEGGMMEVSKAQLALKKATSADVKQFAQRMVDDHTKANNELKAIAGAKQITLPGATPTAALAKLDKLEGAAFDQAYIADQLQDHEKTIALFEREAKSGQDSELKAFATKTLPTLKEHHALVRDLSAKAKKKTSS